MDRFMREAMEAGALGMSTGLEFNPGREATTAELVRLNAIAGEYDGIYTSHVRNRDSGILHAIAEFLEVARAGGIRAEISHLNVRHNTNAPDRGWERAVEMMEAAREEGHGRARRHDAVRRRPRPALRDPAALGGRRRQGGRRSPTCATRRRASACERSATATGGSSTRASGIACACRRASSIPTGTASRSPRSPTFARPTPGTATSTCSPTPATPTRASSSSVRLFTDEHMAEMISHPLFCLGVDTFTVTQEGPLADVLRHPLGYSGHVHYLTHHVRENGTLRLEEAIRKMTSMPAAHFGLWDRGLLRAGYAADVVVFDYDDLDEVSTVDDPHHYARGVEHVLVNGTVVVDDGEHTGARPGRHLLRALRPTDRPPLRSLLGPDRGDVGGDARGRARLGDRRGGRVRQPALRARRGAARQGGRDLGADLRDGEPRRDAHVLRAGRAASCSRRRRTSSRPSRWGSPRSRASRPRPLWAADGRLDPGPSRSS